LAHICSLVVRHIHRALWATVDQIALSYALTVCRCKSSELISGACVVRSESNVAMTEARGSSLRRSRPAPYASCNGVRRWEILRVQVLLYQPQNCLGLVPLCQELQLLRESAIAPVELR